ncbi:cytochrome P450 [Actinophytocola xanthii]|uniref:Cytochrome n=1 Tax=Actinophytocola xanthii TaxID=1912961 RepID=A0A1Q8CXW2_9PSEU|nr:cytochrome P450 [Actinophytocola xanthii]OLF19193.1 cytochrome [Actinophytocola xanthii]
MTGPTTAVHRGTTSSLGALLSRQGRRDPNPFYAELHRRGPVCALSAQDRFDLVVHGYDAVHQALRDPALHVMTGEYRDRQGGTRWRGHSSLRVLAGSMFLSEGADHSRMRRRFAQAFSARRVAALEPAVKRIVARRLDRLAEIGAGGAPVDLLAEFALPVPSDVVGELLGVPESDRDWFPPRVRAFGAILDLGAGVWRYQQAADAAADELSGYFAELLAARRAQPRADLVSALVTAGDGVPGEDDELIANLVTTYNGGFVTTTHLIGNGTRILLDDPAEKARVLADPARTEGFLREVLRYEPPVHFSTRWAASATELAGTAVPRDSRVLVLLGAANRDPRRFTDPDTFDPGRDEGPPLAFGAGVHYCLGAALSAMEGRIALPMLLRRFPDLALAGEPGERTTLMLRGYESLPVTVS